MSEFDRRKKKFYSSKEKEPAMRRPVILVKNDRENDKEKQQSKVPDKPPVIMIKTREQATIKEDAVRPQSPKKPSEQTTEVDVEPQAVHPTKIVQNENKDKRKPQEIPTLTPATPMPHPMKLIDESHDFMSGVAEYLQDNNTGYLVVGVIGAQGVGKSTIMSILAHTHDMSNISKEILNSHIDELYQNMASGDSEQTQSNYSGTSSSKNVEDESSKPDSKALPPLVFKCQNMDQIERGEPCSTGIDIFVTDTRVILLDAGPSGGYGLSRMGGTGVPAGGSRGPVGGCGLEAAAFLLAVCHVVILIQDWFTDVNMLRFIQSAEMVKPAIPAASNPVSNPSHSSAASSAGGGETGDSQVHREYYPHLLFLHNKCNAEDFKPASIKMMQDLYRKAFCKSKMHIESGIFMYEPESTDETCSIDGLFHNLNASRCGKPVNLFLMPAVEEETDKTDKYHGHPTMEELATKLRWQIFGVNRNQLTNVQLSEKSWLQYCNKAWDNIRKSTFFIEYNRLLP